MRTDADFMELRVQYGSPRTDRLLLGVFYALAALGAVLAWFRPGDPIAVGVFSFAAALGMLAAARLTVRMVNAFGWRRVVELSFGRFVLYSRFLAWLMGWPARDDTAQERRVAPIGLIGVGLFVAALTIISVWG